MEQKSEKTHTILLLLTVVLGFIFRVINANTRTVLGDPAHFVVNAINFLNSGLLSLWDQSTFLWYALTNIFYNIFGITQFASRFSSVLFGTFTIFVIYLFVKEFSGNKTLALISSILYAFAPTFIFNAADEHDISTLFFILLAFYCLIRGLKNNSRNYLLLSTVSLGLACMFKAYVPILFLPYFGYIVYYHYTNRFNIKNNYWLLAFMIAILVILAAPTLVYNYSNFKHNGVVTFFFVKFFKPLFLNEKAHQLYDWVSYGELSRGGNIFTRIFLEGNPGDSTYTPPEIYYGLTHSLYTNGPILWLLIFIGSVLMFRKRKEDAFAKDYLVFFLLYFPIPFLFLIDGNFLNKHYVHFVAFGLPIISYLIYRTYIYVKSKFTSIEKIESKDIFIYGAFGLIILAEFFVVLSLPFSGGELLFSKNPEGKFISYKLANIPENSFIFYDNRLYNSQAAWLFNDRYYTTISSLNEFMKYNQASKNTLPVSVYFIECATDDCGWGTIKDNPALNESMEGFFAYLKNQSAEEVYSVKTKLSGLSYYNPLINYQESKETYLIVYKTTMNIDLNLAKQVKLQQGAFMYPIGYENKEDPTFKNFVYEPQGFFEIFINNLAWVIFYLEIVLTFASLFLVLFEIYLII